LLAVLLATVLSESGLAGSAGAASAPTAVADGVAAVVVGMAAIVKVSQWPGWWFDVRSSVFLTWSPSGAGSLPGFRWWQTWHAAGRGAL